MMGNLVIVSLLTLGANLVADLTYSLVDPRIRVAARRSAGERVRSFWRALRRNQLALAGGVVVVFVAVLALLAPIIAPMDPNRYDVKKILDAPSGLHPLGTDQLGRDVLSRMLYGARVSLAVGFVSVGIASGSGSRWGRWPAITAG